MVARGPARGAATGTSGRRLFDALRVECERGFTDGLTLFTGDDLYHLDLALAHVVASLGGAEGGDYAIERFDRDRVDVAEVVAAARSAGMFASRRVVLIRDVALLDGDAEPLAAYAASPPARSHLLVRAPSLDQRRKLHQTIARAGRKLAFSLPANAQAAAETLRALADERGLTLEREAASLLLEIHGGDALGLVAELDKVSAWLGEGARRVGIDGLREIATGGALLTTWETADAILARERGRALAGVRSLVDGGEEPVRLVGALAFRARALLEARARHERGASPAAAIQGLRGIWGATAKILERELPSYTLADVASQAAALLEADRTLKSRSIAPRAVLERLVDRLSSRNPTR